MPSSPVLSIPWQQVLWIVGGATSLTTAIFWGAYLGGKLMSRIEALEKDVTELKQRRRTHDFASAKE